MTALLRKSLFLLLFLSAACQSLSAPTPTLPPTSAPATATVTPSITPTPVPPTETLTPTATASPTTTATPSITPSATATLPPSPTPQATVGFVFDHSESLDAIPAGLVKQLDVPMIAFINDNNRDKIGDARTPQPATNKETLYYVPPTNSAARVAVLDLRSDTGNDVFIAPTGTSLAYLQRESGDGSGGLYIAELTIGIRWRILPIHTLTQRGIYSVPAWTADGTRLAITVATAYDIDIFTIGRDGTNLQNITRNGSYDFYPTWSPDGTRLAFVSDRAICPSWIPGEAGACDASVQTPPNGGNLYLMDVATGNLTMLSDQWISEPPRWLNNTQITFASGDPALGDPERSLWMINTQTGESHNIHASDNSDGPFRLSEAWSPDGSAVFFQSAGTKTDLVGLLTTGSLIGRIDEIAFPRFGMAAAWSPDGKRLAVGGTNNQCPYGVRVLDSTLTILTRGEAPPSMCDPSFSPDGKWLGFAGVNTRGDGRVDIYVANVNGTGAVSLTSGLRGSISYRGWVGG